MTANSVSIELRRDESMRIITFIARMVCTDGDWLANISYGGESLYISLQEKDESSRRYVLSLSDLVLAVRKYDEQLNQGDALIDP